MPKQIPFFASGFILFTVLIFLHLYALLSIIIIEQIFFTKKTDACERNKHILLRQAETKLHELGAAVDIKQLTCFIPRTAAYQLRAYPLSWWRQVACAAVEHDFFSYYVIERLGIDSCVKSEANNITAAYYRITVLSLKPADENLKVFLQGTITQEIFRVSHCDSLRHSVDWGPQYWHEL